MFQPQTIVYEEDALRKEFFGDHPWELARPRVVLENDGKDWHHDDWSRIQQPGRQLSGERFVPGHRFPGVEVECSHLLVSCSANCGC